MKSSQHWEIKSYGNTKTIGMHEKWAALNTYGIEDNKSLPSDTKLSLKVTEHVFHSFHLTESLQIRNVKNNWISKAAIGHKLPIGSSFRTFRASSFRTFQFRKGISQILAKLLNLNLFLKKAKNFDAQRTD